MTADVFIKQFLPVAKVIEGKTGLPSLAILAQSALETGWGTKVKGNSYFGIKAKTGILVRTTEISSTPNLHFPEIFSVTKFKDENGKIKYRYDCKTYFATYATPFDSFLSYAEFILTNPRYSKAVENKDNPERYLQEIARAGYATGLNYEKSVLEVLNSIKNRE
jgi:flagellar protein FlgJ